MSALRSPEPISRTESSRGSSRAWPPTPELWREHVRDSSAGRVYEQIWDDELVNAWLICWSEDQDTGFHDHDRSDAAIRVIEGHDP